MEYKNKNPCPIKRQRSDLCGTTLIAGSAGHSKLCPVTGAAGGAYCPSREFGPLLGGDLRRLVPPPCTIRRLSAGIFGRVLVLFCAGFHITSAILSAFYCNVKQKIREKRVFRFSRINLLENLTSRLFFSLSRCGLGAWPGRFRSVSGWCSVLPALPSPSLRSKLPYAPILTLLSGSDAFSFSRLACSQRPASLRFATQSASTACFACIAHSGPSGLFATARTLT